MVTIAQLLQAKAKKRNSAPKKSKYGNIRTEIDGINFSSKLEANYYLKLKKECLEGIVSYFLTQVAIRLPGGVKYVVDFQVFYVDGRVSYIDTKGVETHIFTLKKKQVESLYPIKIEIVKKV